MSLQVTFKPLGEKILLMEWPTNTIEKSVLIEIIAWKSAIELQLKAYVIECIPAYASLGVAFNPELIAIESLMEKIQSLRIEVDATQKTKKWQLPVCYDETVAADLVSYCELKNLSSSELINLHSSQEYLLHFYGFLPGFMYLGGLDETLHLPRKATPAQRVAAGSVAIGGSQTGIYPIPSPGGWHVIGSCPVKIFNPNTSPPLPMSAGGIVTFESVDIDTYYEIKSASSAGKYHLQCLEYEG